MKAQLFLFNKPCNVLCQFKTDDERLTLKKFIKTPDIYPAGRLDYDSEGLLLLTSNGRLQHLISHPGKKMSKTYLVQVEGIPDESQIKALQCGVELNDGMTLPAKARPIEQPPWLWERTKPVRHRVNIPTSWIEITLTEGRNRQVRRMTAHVGLPTLRLIRQSIGSWNLDNLPPGQHRTEEIFLPTSKNSSEKKLSNRKKHRRKP